MLHRMKETAMRIRPFLWCTLFSLAAACNTSSNSSESSKAQSDASNGDASQSTSNPANSYPTCSTNGIMTQAGSNKASCTTSGQVDVNITIDATKGPNSFSKPLAFTNNLYSMGIDDHTREDYYPSLNPTFVTYLKALHPGMLRFPAGHNGQQYTWSTTDGYTNMTPALVDAFINLCKAVGAEPYMAVNIESAPLADAISLLTYANITKKYNVKWWQIGNEPNLPGLWNYTSPSEYAPKYLNFRNAMLKVDPSIKFVGLESYTGEGILGEHSEVDWFKPFLDGISTGDVDAIAWHYYPLYSSPNNATSTSSSTPTVAHLLQEDASDWPPAGINYPDRIIPYMRTNMVTKAPNAQIWIDEFGEDSGTTLNALGFGDTMVGALWAGDSMLRYAEQGTDAIFKFIFKASDRQDSSGADMQFGYTLLDSNDKLRPEYYTYWLMANQFGDNLVNAKSDKTTQVSAHAAIRAEDCSLRVMLINKASAKQSVRLTLNGCTPVVGSQYNLVGTGYQTKDVTLNNATFNTTNIAQGANAIAPIAAEACSDNIISIPPYAIYVLIFSKS